MVFLPWAAAPQGMLRRKKRHADNSRDNIFIFFIITI
jgi:hypothetical protein